MMRIHGPAPNNMVILNDNTILKVRKILGNPNDPEILQIEGIIWEIEKPVYNYPCDSGKLQMWELKRRPSNRSIVREITSINNKLVRLSIMKENAIKKFYVVGMLH